MREWWRAAGWSSVCMRRRLVDPVTSVELEANQYEKKEVYQMAVKVYSGSSYITCLDYRTAEEVAKAIEAEKKKGKMFFCCKGGGCIVISKITHVQKAVTAPQPEPTHPQHTPVNITFNYAPI